MTTWAKLDDDYYDHPKFAQAGPLVELLWVRMLAWSHRNLSDGVVPVRAIKRLCDFLSEVGEILPPEPHEDPFERPRCDEPTWHDLVTRGIEARLFESMDDGSSIRVHDYCEKQNTAELVEARREAGRRGGIKSGERRQKSQPNEATGQANPEQVLGGCSKPNPSKGQASAQPEVRGQRTDEHSSSSSHQGVAPPASEEEERIREACEALAERALRARRGEALTDPRSWIAKVAGQRHDEHGDAMRALLADKPDLTAHQLASAIEAPPRRPVRERCAECVGGWIEADGGGVSPCQACNAKVRVG